MLHDRIVFGVREKVMRRNLVTLGNLAPWSGLRTVVSTQEAAENPKIMQSAEPEAVRFALQKVRSLKPRTKSEERHTGGKRGGEFHSQDGCKHLRGVGQRCGKRGHLRRLFAQWRQGSYAMEAERHPDSDEKEALHTIGAVLHQEASIRKVKPIYKDITGINFLLRCWWTPDCLLV